MAERKKPDSWKRSVPSSKFPSDDKDGDFIDDLEDGVVRVVAGENVGFADLA